MKLYHTISALQLVVACWVTSAVAAYEDSTTRLRGSTSNSNNGNLIDDEPVEEVFINDHNHGHRNLVGAGLQDAEVILPSGGPISWTVDGITNGLCGSSYDLPLTAVYAGVEATDGSGKIRKFCLRHS